MENFRWCVVIPTYNNDQTLQSVVSGSLAYSENIIVVNDGSTDNTFQILENFSSQITLIDFPENRGKGCALRAGFEKARQLGFTHAITIDSDGQHFPGDIPLFVEAIKKDSNAVIIGARNMESENVPGKSSFGNKFSNFWFRLETGIDLTDTQSGYRAYPLKPMEKLRFFTTKFEFEIESIVKLAWREIPVKNIPIQIHYEPIEKRVSHFRPIPDFTRISLLNTYFVVLAIAYYIPKRFFKSLTRDAIRKFIFRHFLNKEETTWRKSASVGFGVFMGIFPVWGYQMLIGVLLAHLMKLNKAIFLVAANISIPPMIPLIVFGSYKIGGLMIPFEPTEIDLSDELSLNTIWENFYQYLVGAIALAIISGILAGLFTFITVTMYRNQTGRNKR